MTCEVIEPPRRPADTEALLFRASTMQRPLLLITLILFSALTALALWQHGYWGIFEPLLRSTAGLQVLVDLVIALTLFMAWMWGDARRLGRNPWPWIALTLLTGSFGPLLYLLGRPAAPPAP